MLECAISALAVVFSMVMSTSAAEKLISYDNSAISALLRLMSDAVIELDQAFSDFIHSADAARAVELLLDPIGVTSDGGTCAHAFHTRLVDTFSNKAVALSTVRLGLRDFTDCASLSAERAMDAMDSAEELPFSFSWPTSAAESPLGCLRADMNCGIGSDGVAITSTANTDQAGQFRGLHVDVLADTDRRHPGSLMVRVLDVGFSDLVLDERGYGVKVVASASASVTFVAGVSLDDFFPSTHTLQLLQRVFNFEDLPVQWTPEKRGTLVGAFQVVRTRFGGLGHLWEKLMAFR
ncbi:hypothetical protein AK812_SmicGene35332 [Symbiodinium microadriaticum]|uniref:Uncharacterized protein n=1 Tax=Symbiodinium microadriaticum TaxID=2951 RepID=A0A1Q9CLU8_SYMMI|nr:hypothetical protein AK812_SmicGene35332 [Symbiodinium microadriaticum]